MNTKDSLLNHIISQDMAHKNVPCYTITDELVETPKSIQVKQNEAVYIYGFEAKTNAPFKIEVVSPSVAFSFTTDNTTEGKSTRISKHLGTVKFKNRDSRKFLLHYVKIKY